MIEKYIKKYKEQKFSNEFAESSLEALMVNQKIDEILQDLEELKEKQNNGVNKFHQIIKVKDFNELYSVCIEYIKQTKKEILGVDKDE